MLASSSQVDRSPVLSPEAIQALRLYKHQVATYTLRQWNNAKIESERKERDRRRRRADLLAQRAAAAAAGTAATASDHAPPSDPSRRAAGASSSSSGNVIGKHRTSSGNKENGPLMMVSRRRSERTHPAPSSSYGAGSAHLPVPPQNPRHHTAVPVVQPGLVQYHQAYNEPHRSRRQRPKSHSPARHGALDQNSNVSSYAFDRPTIHHLESVIASLDLDDSHVPLDSASTPPIPIPLRTKEADPEDSLTQSVPSNVSSPSSPSHKRPARVLGFTAHLGMTSISNREAKDTITTSSSASTSNPTSSGSSRMSSFSETSHTLHNVRKALKDVSDETPIAENLDAWPIKMYGEALYAQGDDEHLFGPMEHH